MNNQPDDTLSDDYVKLIKKAQHHNYLKPNGVFSHILDSLNKTNTCLSSREPKKILKAQIILRDAKKLYENYKNSQNDTKDLSDHSDQNIKYYNMNTYNISDQLNVDDKKTKKIATQYIGKEGVDEQVEQKLNSIKNETFAKRETVKLYQKFQEKEDFIIESQKEKAKLSTSIIIDTQLKQLNDQKIPNHSQSDFQSLQNNKLNEYKELEEKRKYCELDKRQVKKEKFKYQKILYYYQTLLCKYEQQLIELSQVYPFLLNNEAVNNILDIIPEESQFFSSMQKFQVQQINENQLFDNKQQQIASQIDQQDQQNKSDCKQDLSISNLNSNSIYQVSSQQSDQILKNIKIVDYSNINLTNKNASSSEQDMNENNTIIKACMIPNRSEAQLLQLYGIYYKYIADISKYISQKKIKINGKSHVVIVIDAKKVIEKTLSLSKKLFKINENHKIFIILRLKQIKKQLIQKQDDCLERLNELFKVNFWPKEYKYTREKGSKEKQKQIQEEIEKNKPLLQQNKQLLLDISKKKFEMKKENPQKKREIQKLENYLIKRHQDERKLSKKLQLHNQMKNFIMYSIRYVADNISYEDPEDVNRQKKILKIFHLTYNKSDLQALVSPQVPYSVEQIENIISLNNDKSQFKYNQFFDYQKQMISQYNPDLFEQFTVMNLTWEKLRSDLQILQKFNKEIERLNMFNKYNRIFMQRFCLFEYHKIILKGKANKIDHFYGNNFILSGLSHPKIIQL